MKEFLKILAVVAVGIIAGAYLDRCQHPKQAQKEPPDHAVIDTVTYYDTIPYYLPVPKQEVQLGTQIKFLPVFLPKDSAIRDSCNNAVENIPDISPDSVAVEIPITQREYEGTEYHAWVSGYDPKLDSIFVFPRHDVVTIKEPPNKKRWGIGVFAGYGMTPHGFEPCAGISINYNLWNF